MPLFTLSPSFSKCPFFPTEEKKKERQECEREEREKKERETGRERQREGGAGEKSCVTGMNSQGGREKTGRER